MPHNDLNLIQVILHGVVAIFGGIVRALSDGNKKFKGIIIEGFIAGFSGSMLGLLAINITDSQSITLVIAGTGGYMGVESIKLLANWVSKKLNKDF